MELRRSASDVAEIRDILDETNRAIHKAFIDRASRHEFEIGHVDPDRALRCGLFLTNAGAREAVLSGALATYRLRVRPDELKTELGTALSAYLKGRG